MEHDFTTARPRRLPHHPGLDGLRGLAVIGVLLFHGGFGWARGGFLGVSAFFTLSGFLITTLLLSEHASTGRIALGRFWARRTRRLLPAALVALAGVALFGRFIAGADQLHALRADGLAALGYVANWRFVLSGKSYSAIFAAPSPAQHFWSLAIEEQFYVVFPLLAAGLLALGRGSRRFFTAALLVLTGLSILATFALYRPGFDPSRVYYGTDTRAAELLVGALLAVMMARTWSRQPTSGVDEPHAVDSWWALARRVLLQGGGLAGLTVMATAWMLTPQNAVWLYRGGLVGLAIVTAIVIRAAIEPAGVVRRLLAWTPLARVGAVSYGVYLYHWPIFLWLSSRRTGLEPARLFALRVSVTLIVAIASYFLIEQPIRTGRRLVSGRRLVALPTLGAAVATAFVAVTVHSPVPALDLSSVSSRHAPTAVGTAAAPPSAPHAMRVMVVGDSISYVLGQALTRFGDANNTIQVWNVAVPGCGVARGGDLVGPGGIAVHTTQGCNEWADRWKSQVEEFRPDVVMMLSGSWDLTSRRIDEWSAFHSPGEAIFDDWLEAEYNSAVDVLTSTGARLVWVNAPCLEETEGAATRAGMFDPSRAPLLNGTVLHDLASSRADRVTLVDLYSKVCPNGRLTQKLGGSSTARPDGVHFDDTAADWVAAWLVPQLTAD